MNTAKKISPKQPDKEMVAVMFDNKAITLALSISLGVVVLVGGCRSEKFESAPSAEAPPPGDESTSQRQKPMRKSGQLPADHPPVGGSEGSSNTQPQVDTPDQNKQLPVDWSAPDSWSRVEPSSRMRAAQYRISPGSTDKTATLAVYYFGPNQGGGIEANISRWTGQFSDKRAKPQRSKETVNGLDVYTVEIAGTYSPGMMGDNSKPKPGYRMVGIIAETEGAGPVFFKLTGPQRVVKQSEKQIDDFKQSLSARK